MRVTAASLVLLLTCARGALAYDWLQFNGDPAHSGNNRLEQRLSAGNVAALDLRFQIALPDVADGAPVILTNVATASGTRDLAFVTTKAGDIVALDAQSGVTVWSARHGANGCRINNNSQACYTTSSPALDPNRQFVYSYGLDGYVHKHAVADGAEASGGGWPALATMKGFDEKGSSALGFASLGASTYLYVTHGGYPGDAGDYQGHVTAIDLATGAQNVFNAMCSDQAVHLDHTPASPSCNNGNRSAIWARPGAVFDAETRRLLVATGNGSFDANQGGHNWSESILALGVDARGANGRPLDSYTPAEFQGLDEADADLGSSAPAILPVPASSRIRHLALQTGKDAKLRLVDLANMNGSGSAGAVGGEINAPIALPHGGVVLTQPAVWQDAAGTTWVFVGNGNGLSAYRLVVDEAGTPSLALAWSNQLGGSSPLVVNGVLYQAASFAMRAFDPQTGDRLWTESRVGGVHWQSPVGANGVLYVADESAKLTAFALPASSPLASAIEFYNASLDHYFITAAAPEIAALDSGTTVGWQRTGNAFNVYAQANASANAVCRFYIPPARGDSHFYSASSGECADVLAKFPFFTYESSNVFHVATPDIATGACDADTVPVYRVWNGRADSNHRYTTSRSVRDLMVAAGWIAEGYGPDAVIMCAPA
jgi:hypothetical protein